MDAIKDRIREILAASENVDFGYLYGSFGSSEAQRDIDIAVYLRKDCDPSRAALDLEIALSDGTGIPPDIFDVRILNDVLENGDLFSLLYLKKVLSMGELVRSSPGSARSDFLERFAMKYRSCEGLFQEVLI